MHEMLCLRLESQIQLLRVRNMIWQRVNSQLRLKTAWTLMYVVTPNQLLRF